MQNYEAGAIVLFQGISILPPWKITILEIPRGGGPLKEDLDDNYDFCLQHNYHM